MIAKGNKFKYYLDNESTTYSNILNEHNSNFTVSVDGLNIYYYTPGFKKTKKDKTLQQADKTQKQNGGRLDLDSLIYAFELNDKVSMENFNKEFYDICHSEITGKLQETLVDRHAKAETVLPKDFQAVAADVDRREAFQWQQLMEVAQLPFDVDKCLERLAELKLEEPVKGKKESDNKLDYELDWEFIQQMAERMSSNKGKYPTNNWKLPMDVDKLKQSLLRHTLEIIKGKDADDNRPQGHYEAVALNAMMICYQLRNNL